MRTSASRVITSAFDWDQPDFSDEKTALKDGLRTVSRVLYAAGGLHDQHIRVAYSDGQSVNDVGNPTVFLNPDVVLKPREEFDYDLRNDVLVGTALVGANSKLTAQARVYRGVTQQECDETIKRVYHTTEFRAAEMRVDREAPGLAAYLDTRAQYYADQEFLAELQSAADAEETHSDVACALLNNAMLHRGAGEPVDMGVYAEAVNEAVGRLERCNKSEERYAEATAVVTWLRDMFDPEQPPPPPEGDGGDEEAPEDDQPQEPGAGSGLPGDGESGDGNDQPGEGEPGSEKPGEQALAQVNAQFDKEMSVVAGQMESEQGQSATIQACIGEDNAVDVGEEQPAKGWGDEVEPTEVRVQEHVIGNAAGYQAIRNDVLVGIRTIVNKLSWTAQVPTLVEHGYRSGNLDEGSFTNLFIQDERPAVFERVESMARPDVAVGIMVDESGSMSGANICAARRISVMLVEAMKQIVGTRIRIWGHTAASSTCIVYPYVTAQNSIPYGLIRMCARDYNIDGAALWYAAQELSKFDADAQRRILFCISDGLPSGGSDGVAYNRKKAIASRHMGVEVYGLGVENAYTAQQGTALFGQDAFCILPDVESAGQVISAFITRVVNRMK